MLSSSRFASNIWKSAPCTLRVQSFSTAFKAPSAFQNTGKRAGSLLKRRTITNQAASKDRAALGVLTPGSAALFIGTGVALYFYFSHEKQAQIEAREKARETKAYGRPSIGGPFTLYAAPSPTPSTSTTATSSTPSSSSSSSWFSSSSSKTPEPSSGTPEDQATAAWTEKNLLGKWTLLYFGFTNCPDICPAEMDKMGEILTDTQSTLGPNMQPVFVTVDPARDSPSRITQYLEDFHPRFIGLYGTYEQTKAVCKAYRVYFSTPPTAKPEDDYLVDHSIFLYLLDPNGEFVEAFGQAVEKDAVVERIQREVTSWEAEYGKKYRA
ncbi:SCO1/SenC-domain-containing protein [Pterulicium gracile]|uniref:SCO1/SenC-domain-containing protein n=1 Tax=Pterulicium gracile TaxID=1884261 RepID=A0A5C3R3Q8_9AGAR|nr:SCO1/SenC-domain-containing protein [Pterula gracilis]